MYWRNWLHRGITRDSGRTARLIVGCVADNNRKYLDQALRLLQSWRWFGGEIANADFCVCVVDAVEGSDRHAYESYGARVHIVERYDKRHPPSNKLRFLQLPDLGSYDHVLLLDCDTIVVRDPYSLLNHLYTADFVAKIADLPTVPHEIFESLFAHFDIRLPRRNFHFTVSGQSTIPYFNAGVLAFSKHAVDVLVPEWIRLNGELLNNLDKLGTQGNFCEQASLSLALSKTNLRFHTVGNEFNFPAHLTDKYPKANLQTVDPHIIHYHSLIDDKGFLLKSNCPKVDLKISEFNERLRSERRTNFDNRQFWNSRYLEEPGRGSGKGSRGEVLQYKRLLLERAYQHTSASTVLDIGCGDMETGSIFPDRGYTGVDISDVIVQRNTERFPNRSFVHGDMNSTFMEAADLVVCLDVLIHLPGFDAYRNSVARLVQLANIYGIVAGYDEQPANQSDITYFHEPLSVTLQSVGAKNVRRIGGYNQVVVYEFGRQAGAMATSNRPRTQSVLDKPLFLVGTMRSGTTLLANLLDHHTEICYCKFELKDIWSAAGVSMASPKTREQVCKELGEDAATVRMSGELTHAFLQRMRAVDGKRSDAIFLNKNPHLCNKLPFVKALFPDSRFIWVHRRLPQVVASVKRLFSNVNARQGTWHYWPESSEYARNRCWHARFSEEQIKTLDPSRVFPGGNVRYICEYWLESNRAIYHFLNRANPKEWLEVAEESLLGSPVRELSRCLAFLELPYMVSKEQVDSLDIGRNSEWCELLTETERLELRAFVQDRSLDIDNIFPGQHSSEYLAEVNATISR